MHSKFYPFQSIPLMRIPTYLCQQITKSPTDQGGHGLGDEGFLVQGFIVGRPSRHGTSTDLVQVPKQGTRCGAGVLGEGQGRRGLRARRGVDTKRTDGEERRDNDEKRR